MIVRDGHLWCLEHGKPWRECPCPGDVSINVTIDAAAIAATQPRQGAFLEYLKGRGIPPSESSSGISPDSRPAATTSER